jgi:hypothetical protein
VAHDKRPTSGVQKTMICAILARMSSTMAEESVKLPKKSFKNLLRAMDDFRNAQEEIEDSLIFSNPNIMKEIKSARKEHQNGRTIEWNELTKSYGL